MPSSLHLTAEQEAIIHHPCGCHARVLAVAGSGKTTTLVHRLRHLLLEEEAAPTSVLVLMFNRLARQQFEEKLARVGLPEHLRPRVYTFHAFAYHFIRAMIRTGLIPRYTDLWVGARGELERLYARRAIENLEKRRIIPPETVDVSEVLAAIGLWKGALLSPERAGYRGNPDIPVVYGEFEKLRHQQRALTFDDFVPTAVTLLESNNHLRNQWCERVDHLIVDEYQDVNFGQHRLIELLAGQRADVMVVGDDDQTIYEWRGARPHYIVEGFAQAFANKSVRDYQLSHSFRFGPLLAQCAYNTIRLNQYRVDKRVLAHAVSRPARISRYQTLDSMESTRAMVEQIVSLVTQKRVWPRQIVVLARLYAQLAPLEMECLSRRVPYQVLGQDPFFSRTENMVLRNYLDVALSLDQPVSGALGEQLLSIANKPTRYLSRRQLEKALDGGRLYGFTLAQVLERLVGSLETPFSHEQRLELEALLHLLRRIAERIRTEQELLAGPLLAWLVDVLDYLASFDDYYGPGESSLDRKESVKAFVKFADFAGLKPVAFLDYLDGLDTTRGKPEDELLTMTSIHRTKGLEWDYVFLPEVQEHFLPYLGRGEAVIYDLEGEIDTELHSPALERERRLFYVALTRARREVHLQAPLRNSQAVTPLDPIPSRFLEEIQPEATGSLLSLVPRLSRGAGDPQLAERLRQCVETHGGFRHIVDPLLEYYLPEIDQQPLADQIETMLAGIAPVSFAYQHAYPEMPEEQPERAPGKGQPWSELAREMYRIQQQRARQEGDFTGRPDYGLSHSEPED